jgi:hypothetical protein
MRIDAAGCRTLRQKCLRLDDAQRPRHAAEEIERATARMLEIADEEIERAITATIERLGERAADLYARLVRGAPYSDVKLIYRPTRSGQVEFSLTFDGRHADVSPPQRIMSTSQLNALGLALMLARLSEEPCGWRTLVLDDVVNAFDATHRQGLARLLADEFADWQVIVLTHDRAFREILRSVTKQWRFQEVIAFSPRSGPVFNDADPRVELRRRLVEDGATAMELAHLARRALEQGLWRPLYKLRFPALHFDPEQRYGVRDYLHALRRGFKQASSPLKDLRVLARMEVDSYMVNLGVHDRFDAAALSTDDLLRLADDLDELDAALHCQGCRAPIWRQDGGAGMHCACGTLKLAA